MILSPAARASSTVPDWTSPYVGPEPARRPELPFA